jgi:serine/threonine-protein kinase HipA
MPVQQREWRFDRFPPFFDGLLPEGPQLQALLKIGKLDRTDFFGQLLAVGQDMVGDVTVEPS